MNGTLRTFAAFLLAWLVAACVETANVTPSMSQAPAEGAEAKGPFAQFTDIPIPKQAKMNMARTLILGSQDAWTGRVYIEVAQQSATALYEFYKSEMPNFDWAEVTTVRAEISVLTYQRDERVATIQISSSKLQGTEVSITMSPRGAAAAPK